MLKLSQLHNAKSVCDLNTFCFLVICIFNDLLTFCLTRYALSIILAVELPSDDFVVVAVVVHFLFAYFHTTDIKIQLDFSFFNFSQLLCNYIFSPSSRKHSQMSWERSHSFDYIRVTFPKLVCLRTLVCAKIDRTVEVSEIDRERERKKTAEKVSPNDIIIQLKEAFCQDAFVVVTVSVACVCNHFTGRREFVRETLGGSPQLALCVIYLLLVRSTLRALASQFN